MRGKRKRIETEKDIHLYSRLSRAEFCQSACALFLPLLLRYPHVLLVGDLRIVLVGFRDELTEAKFTYQVGKHGTTQENHVPPSRGVFDADLEFLWFVFFSSGLA